MRVAVTVAVDVDPEAWAEYAGVERADVRADVKRYIQASVLELELVRDTSPEQQ